MADSSRLYGDKEIRAILKRAAERQHLDPDQPTGREGLTLEELQQVAAEAGIDPVHVEAAVAEMQRGDNTGQRGFHIWGGPIWVEQERIVPGEVTDAHWEAIVAEARHAFNKPGHVVLAGCTRTWHYEKPNAKTHRVTVVPGEGKTRVRVYNEYVNYVAAIHGPLLSIGFIIALLAAAFSGSVLLGTGLFIGIFGAAVVLARAFFGYVSRFQRDKTEQLTSRIESILSGGGWGKETPSTAQTASPQHTGSLTPPDKEAPAREEPPGTRRRTRS